MAPKPYVMDESLSWEERYRQLEAYHAQMAAYFMSVIELAKTKLDQNMSGDPEQDVDMKTWEANLAAHHVLSAIKI